MKKAFRFRRLLLPFFSIVIAKCSFAQDTLGIGDRLPILDIEVRTPDGSLIPWKKLNKKLILIDFWSHNCGGCLNSFPHIDSVQAAFKDDIAIVLVNRESPDSTAKFFKRFPRLLKPKTFMISGDTLLKKLFPHDLVPYHIWIDSSGQVVHKTAGYNASIENVHKFLRGEHFPVKYISNRRNYVTSLFPNEALSMLKAFSYLSKCDMNSRLTTLESNDTSTLSFNCASITELYQFAFGEGSEIFRSPGRTILELKNPEKYYRPKLFQRYDEWVSEYSFNYQVKIPESNKKQLYSFFRKDLERYFGLRAEIVERPVKFLVLIRTSKVDKLTTQHSTQILKLYRSSVKTEKFEPIRFVQNIPFSEVSRCFQASIEKEMGISFKDETQLTQNVDIKVDGKAFDKMDIKTLRENLQRYDLDIVEGINYESVLILND